jgi:hypothetical protein
MPPRWPAARENRARTRLATYSIYWLSQKRKTLKPLRLDRYARTLAHRIVAGLGDHYIDAIKHQDIVLWRDAQTAKTSTVNGWLRVLKTMLAHATVADNLLRRSVRPRHERMTEHYSRIGNDEKSSAVAKVVQLVRRAPVRRTVQVRVTGS